MGLSTSCSAISALASVCSVVSHMISTSDSRTQIQMIAILNAFDPWGKHLDHSSRSGDDEPSSQDAGNRSVLRTSDSESQPARRKGEMSAGKLDVH